MFTLHAYKGKNKKEDKKGGSEQQGVLAAHLGSALPRACLRIRAQILRHFQAHHARDVDVHVLWRWLAQLAVLRGSGR